MSKGLGKIEKLVLIEAIELSAKGSRLEEGRIGRGAISNSIRSKLFGYDKPRSGSITKAMQIIGGVKKGTWVFTDGRSLTEEELKIHRENRVIRDSISRAIRGLVKKGYFEESTVIGPMGDWKLQYLTLADKCKLWGQNPPNGDT